MTIAALALALAVLVAPTPRRLLPTRVATAVKRRPPLWWAGAVAALTVGCVAPVAVSAAGVVVAGTVALRVRRRRRERRRVAESAVLQGALDVLVGELSIGSHPVAAFDVAASEADGVIAASLAAVAARARLGADVASGLRSVGGRSALPGHWERLAVCWQLAQTHGLAIATLVRAAQRDIVERDRFAARVDAGMAGARTTAAVLAGLPVLAVLMGQLIGAAPLAFLLSPGLGGTLLVIGVLLACAGLLWSDRITSGVLR